MYLELSNNGDWTNDTIISGLPFNPAGLGPESSVGMYSSNITYLGQLVAAAQDAGAPLILLHQCQSALAVSRLLTSGVPDNGAFAFSLSYYV
jgi:hypothetical protein